LSLGSKIFLTILALEVRIFLSILASGKTLAKKKKVASQQNEEKIK
jgi:hypothetical protein